MRGIMLPGSDGSPCLVKLLPSLAIRYGMAAAAKLSGVSEH